MTRRCQDAGDELEDGDVLGVGVMVASVVPTRVGMRADVDVDTDVVEGSGSDDDGEKVVVPVLVP